MDGRKPKGTLQKATHSDTIQLLPHVVLAVEPAWLRRGTARFPVYSHYEEEDLIRSKKTKSSRVFQIFVRGIILGGRWSNVLILIQNKPSNGVLEGLE